MGELLREVSQMPVTVTENGKSRKITTEKAILLKLRSDCLRGIPSASRLWLGLQARYAPEQMMQSLLCLEAEDERVLAEYRAKVESAARQSLVEDNDDEP